LKFARWPETPPLDYQDPAIYVSRRNGRPAVVGSNCSDARRAKGFVSLLAGPRWRTDLAARSSTWRPSPRTHDLGAILPGEGGRLTIDRLTMEARFLR